MTRGEARLQHASNLLVGGTGLVYAWMLYGLEPVDEFSLVNHPWQPDLLHLHVLFAPLWVFALGMIWRRHVWARVRAGHRPRRPTGLVLAIGALPMAVSGYGIQISVDDRWRGVWVAVHLVSSAFWVLGYAAHQGSRRGPDLEAVREGAQAAGPPPARG